MPEEFQSNPISTTAQVQPAVAPVAPQAPVQPVSAAQNAINNNVPVDQQTLAPKPQPYKIDRLGQNKEYVYKDKNGFEWHYTFQFPGIRKMMAILDEARMPNGAFANSKLYASFCKDVIVAPRNLSLDDFDQRPGMQEVMDACDEFCGQRISL